MTFTSIPCMNLFASEGENVKENLGAELEVTIESLTDAMSYETAGKWGQAFADGFWPNSFHNQVQRDIRSRYENVEDKEHWLTYKIGKKEFKGRADIVMRMGEVAYIWEIKPYSYLKGTNGSVAMS